MSVNATAAALIVTTIAAIAKNGDEATAHAAIAAAKRDALRTAYKQVTGESHKGMTAAQLREALTVAAAEEYNAWSDAGEPTPAPAPEKKARKPRGSKYTGLLTTLMADFADADGVAVVDIAVLLERGFAKSTTVYHADWHHSMPCGKAAGALGIVGRLNTKNGTVTLRQVAA